MRACTSTHLFQETSPSHYTHNAFSAIFLLPANRDMFKQMYDFLGQGVYAIPRFLESIKYKIRRTTTIAPSSMATIRVSASGSI